MINKKMSLEDLNELYKRSVIVAYGSPDQYQFHQNELSKGLAIFLLQDFWEKESQKDDNEDLKSSH